MWNLRTSGLIEIASTGLSPWQLAFLFLVFLKNEMSTEKGPSHEISQVKILVLSWEMLFGKFSYH
jgi:hypothetical protein